MYDTIIIGAGPSGLTAAIYLLRDNKKVLILERETIGGKIASSPLVQNYPGYKEISGAELSNEMYEQVMNLGGKIEIEEVLEIVPEKNFKVVTDMGTHEAKSIILACGSTNRLLKIPKEEDYIGNGISFCTVCDGAFYKDGIVSVVGGGNSALTNALSLAKLCKKVYLLVRKPNLKGDKKRIEEVEKTSNIIVLYNTIIKSLEGKESLEKITIETDGTERQIDIDAIFVSIGQEPNTDFVSKFIKLSENKYIEVDKDGNTNRKGIFACGDIIEKKVRQLTTAVNDGTIAALSTIEYLNTKEKELLKE